MFRVDASSRIGSGHVARCMALATTLRDRGLSCLFLHRRHPGHMANHIREGGFEVVELPEAPTAVESTTDTDYASWLGVPQEEDARECQETLSAESIDWLIVDHYSLDATWEDHLRPRCRHLAVIDDLANRPHNCDLLIDQNYVPHSDTRYLGLVPGSCSRLIGPRYAILTSTYTIAHSLVGPRRGPLARVLIYYGGTDVTNETDKALRALSLPEFADIAVDIVIGHNARGTRSVAQAASSRPMTTVHAPRPHIADLMIDANLAFGAGGTTTWERCAIGVPSVVTAVARNQVETCQTLAGEGYIHYMGHHTEVNVDSLTSALRRARDSTYLDAMGSKAWGLVDGHGTARVADCIHP